MSKGPSNYDPKKTVRLTKKRQEHVDDVCVLLRFTIYHAVERKLRDVLKPFESVRRVFVKHINEFTPEQRDRLKQTFKWAAEHGDTAHRGVFQDFIAMLAVPKERPT